MDDQDRQFKFLFRSYSLLFLHHLIIFVLLKISLANFHFYKDFFRNFNDWGNGYDIVSLIVIPLILVFSIFFKKYTRMFAIALYIVFVLTSTYMTLFLYQKFAEIEYDVESMTASVIVTFFSCTFGSYMMLLCMRTKVNVNISIITSIFLYGIHEILMRYLY